MVNKTAIVIFSDDFRIQDNPAFFYASKNYQNIIPLFVYDEFYLGRKLGSASKVFLHHALNSFNKLLKSEYGFELVIKEGEVIEEIKKIEKQHEISAIYFNNSYTKKQIETEENIKKTFEELDVKSFKAKIFFEKGEILTGAKTYFKVFTPFSKECLKKIELIGECLKSPENVKSNHKIKSLKIDDLKLLPKNEGNWHKKAISFWEMDYEKIKDNIIKFSDEGIENYTDSRNFPALKGTSRISPYLRFGMFSPRIIYYTVRSDEKSKQFILELLWREFAFHILHYFKDVDKKELKPWYAKFAWENDKKLLAKWQKGETGFDIVDAGMRELWVTGFMHNRVRMITASFLIKDLMIDWKIGEEWFWDCLFDACPAVNAFSWQWVFGSGFDAAPYFRIFNPDLQKEKFDNEGIYSQEWLGEKKFEKIVDHDFQRKIALAKYKKSA